MMMMMMMNTIRKTFQCVAYNQYSLTLTGLRDWDRSKLAMIFPGSMLRTKVFVADNPHVQLGLYISARFKI